jgi:coproporphyrinogen III oxidase
LPPEVRWEYGFAPDPGTPEAESLAAIVTKRDWANAPATPDPSP